ncbi:MAG: CpsD/CapB family tyrosine-protein kinase [Pseudomonadota bacterium]
MSRHANADRTVVPLRDASEDPAASGSSPGVAAPSMAALAERRLMTPDSARDVTNAYNTIRATALQRLGDLQANSLAVVSPISGDGKSLTAANLAISVAREEGRSAVLVDLDLHRPSLARLFAAAPLHGVDDFLSGRHDDIEAMRLETGFDRLSLLPVRRARSNASELVASERAADMLTRLCQPDPSRLVIVDLPPLLATPDARLMVERCGASLLVVRDGHTPAPMLTRAAEILDGHPIAGVVLNNSRDESNQYYNY